MGTIVIEAGLNSGALITACLALENNREVMAIPGKIDSPLSRGSNRLIKDGARLVDSVQDVIETLGHVGEQLKEHVGKTTEQATKVMELPLFDVGKLKLSPCEKKTYECLSKEPTHLEQIISEANLPTGDINAALVSLQLKGLIKNLPGNLFLKK